MILKVKQIDTTGKRLDSQWWVYDNIDCVNWLRVDANDWKDKDYLELYAAGLKDSSEGERAMLIEAKRYLPIHGEVKDLFVVETEAYLCNDEGVTIEKIAV